MEGSTASFQVQAGLDGLAEESQVAVLNVPPILPEMDCDPVSAGEFRLSRRPDRVRLTPASSLAKGGDVVNIHSQTRHASHLPASLPSHWAGMVRGFG